MSERADLLANTTPAFRAVHAELGRRFTAVFPDAKAVEVWDMAAWEVKVPDPPSASSWKGTMPRDVLTFGPTEKKAGITIHFWHPNAPYLLRDNAAWLKEAGFKPMVGCLQWNRKSDMPLDALVRLFEAAKQAM